jgi:hypothetical protein
MPSGPLLWSRSCQYPLVVCYGRRKEVAECLPENAVVVSKTFHYIFR